MMHKVIISEDFSLYPMGRTKLDGPNNGHKFFNEFLSENLRNRKKTIIVLDGINSLGSSFVDQVFHVMPREMGLKSKEVNELIAIEAEGRAYRFYKKMIEDFIKKISQ